MTTRRKKKGWFFKRDIINEINSIQEESITDKKETNIEIMNIIFEKDEQIKELKKALDLEKQRAEKENEKYKQLVLRSGKEKADSRCEIKTLEATVRKKCQEIKQLQDSSNLAFHNMKLSNADEEVIMLNKSLKKLKKKEVELNEMNQQLKIKMNDLLNKLQKKEAVIDKLEDIILEKNNLNQKLHARQDLRDPELENGMISNLRNELSKFKSENNKLKTERVHSQNEISEILIRTHRQADHIVNQARVEAQSIATDLELQLLTICEFMKKIANDVGKSQSSILNINDELNFHIEKLKQKNSSDLQIENNYNLFDINNT